MSSNTLETNLTGSALHPDVPLNVQIYGLLREEIEDGVWEGRAGFPGEVELAQRYGVSVITTRTALDRLASEGRIKRGRGIRTVAMPSRRRLNQSAALVMPTAGERVFSYKLLSAELGAAPAEACEVYGVPAGTELWTCMRLRRYQGRLHSVTLNVQLPAIGLRHTKKALSTLPMADSLRELGLPFTKMKRRVGVGFAPRDVAVQLQITVQDPTLVYTFVLYEPDQTPVEWVRIYVHPHEQQHWEIFDIQTPDARENARV